MSRCFGQVFSSLRKEKGLSQRQVANDLEISQALLSHYENGLREPRLDFISTICDYYGVSADYLLGRTDARNNYGAMLRDSDIDADILLGATAAVIHGAYENKDTGDNADRYLSGAVYKLMCELKLTEERAREYDEHKMAEIMMLYAESDISVTQRSGKIKDETLEKCAKVFLENTERRLSELSGKNPSKEKTDERTE